MQQSPYPEWLKDAILYQIFPASYCDSNGDGIGDLNGICSKLDHIQSTGADTLWLSPIFDSPFRDAGYDVRDYKAIAPRYGTMEDLEQLVAETHARGMRLLLDFIPGHTSNEHPWFIESSKHTRNAYSDWYVWTDRTFDLNFKAPGQYINGHAERDGNYLANFFYFQPALNYGFADPDPLQAWQLPVDHPSVQALRAEIHSIMRFWLDKGIDGFRVDMAAFLVKGTQPERIQECMIEFWKDVRSWWDRDYPDALLLAEWSDPTKAIESGFHLDFMIHFGDASGMKPFRAENNRTIFPSDDASYFDRQVQGDIHAFFEQFMEYRKNIEGRGFLSLPTGNHDLPRFSVDRSAEDLKLIYAFLLTLPHVPTIYYGDEIGMRNFSDLTSKEGGYVRTGARTPMQWDTTENAGFSKAGVEALYLPLDPDPQRPLVSQQIQDSDSLLHHMQSLIQLRKSHPALGSAGRIHLLNTENENHPLLYLRENEGQAALIAINPLNQPRQINFNQEGQAGEILSGHATLTPSSTTPTHQIQIEALSYAIFEWEL